MDSLQINSSVKRLAINDDPTRIISFDPGDVTFAERFYALMREFQTRMAEYQARASELEADQAVDLNGIPINAAERIAVTREACMYIRERIDYLFGTGTSQTAFGDALSMDAFEQFFTGITPFISAAREEKILKYANQQNAGRVMK